MVSAVTRMRVFSQLEPFFNEALQERLGLPVTAIPGGAPVGLPPEPAVLVAAPIALDATRPAGWPYGVQWVQLVTSGTDKHPAWLLRGVPTATARGVAAEPIAEYALAAMLYHSKQLDQLWVQQPGDWATRPLASFAGAQVGLVGLGAIGSAVARKALALGARVQALRATTQPSPVPGVALVQELQALLASSDHLVLAAPATARTRQLLNARTLRHAKTGLHIVNVARGELIDDAALLAAIERGQVHSATLDATVPEPLPQEHPFYRHPRIRLSPHTAAIGQPARLALVEKFVANWQRWQAGQPLIDLVT